MIKKYLALLADKYNQYVTDSIFFAVTTTGILIAFFTIVASIYQVYLKYRPTPELTLERIQQLERVCESNDMFPMIVYDEEAKKASAITNVIRVNCHFDKYNSRGGFFSAESVERKVYK